LNGTLLQIAVPSIGAIGEAIYAPRILGCRPVLLPSGLLRSIDTLKEYEEANVKMGSKNQCIGSRYHLPALTADERPEMIR
jgi:hypothetical protein